MCFIRGLKNTGPLNCAVLLYQHWDHHNTRGATFRAATKATRHAEMLWAQWAAVYGQRKVIGTLFIFYKWCSIKMRSKRSQSQLSKLASVIDVGQSIDPSVRNPNRSATRWCMIYLNLSICYTKHFWEAVLFQQCSFWPQHRWAQVENCKLDSCNSTMGLVPSNRVTLASTMGMPPKVLKLYDANPSLHLRCLDALRSSRIYLNK